MKNPVGKLVIIIMLVTALLQLATGCTPLDFVKAVIPTSKPAINAEAQVGDRTAALGDSDSQSLSIDETNGDVAVTNNQVKQKSNTRVERAETVKVDNAPVWMVILLIIGWVMPTPRTLWHGLLRVISKRKG